MSSVVEKILAERKTLSSGRLRTLTDRRTTRQLERRTAKIAVHVGREGAVTRGMLMSVLQLLNRGFWGRMKYAFLGK